MAEGIFSARIMASCPAPLTMRCGLHPVFWIACSISLTRNESIATAGWFKSVLRATDSPRRFAISSAWRTRASTVPVRIWIRAVSHIEGQPSLSGNDVGRAGLRIDPAYGRHQVWNSVSLLLDRDDPFCCCGDGIVPKMHRRRAGVVGASEECELQPALARDGFDRRQRPPQFLQDRSLLNMKLHVTQGIVF